MQCNAMQPRERHQVCNPMHSSHFLSPTIHLPAEAFYCPNSLICFTTQNKEVQERWSLKWTKMKASALQWGLLSKVSVHLNAAGSKKPCCGWQLKRLFIENSWKFNRFVQNGFTNWNSNGVDFQSEIQQSCLKLGHILKQQWRCPTEIYVLTMDSIGKYWFYSFEFWAHMTLSQSTPHTDES